MGVTSRLLALVMSAAAPTSNSHLHTDTWEIDHVRGAHLLLFALVIVFGRSVLVQPLAHAQLADFWQPLAHAIGHFILRALIDDLAAQVALREACGRAHGRPELFCAGDLGGQRLVGRGAVGRRPHFGVPEQAAPALER